jgi:hypothetical protein
LVDDATGDEASPITTPERVALQIPQGLTSESGMTPSVADQSIRREDSQLIRRMQGGEESFNLLKQRSLNAVNTNLPRALPNSSQLPPKLASSGSATKLINIGSQPNNST